MAETKQNPQTWKEITASLLRDVFSPKMLWALIGAAGLSLAFVIVDASFRGGCINFGFFQSSGCDNEPEQPLTAEKVKEAFLNDSAALATITGKDGKDGADGAIPAGAVVAFDLPGQCPAGWTPFAESQGVVMLGASFGIPNNLFRDVELTQRKYRDHGGKEQVPLKSSELPPHIHNGRTGSPSGQWNTSVIPSGDRGGFATRAHTQEQRAHADTRPESWPEHTHAITTDGGVGLNAEPHENMPPYIALYFCKKD